MAEEIKIVASAVGFDQVNKALDSTSKTLTQTSEAAVKAGKALNTELKTGSTQASQSITNLSRVLQDAPFGFIGIANNINPLIESFSRLKAESGSVGGALKSLVGGLAGGGGLGIAFAAITSAITFAQIGLSMWSRGSDKAKKTTEEFSDQLEVTKQSLKAVTEELKNFIAVGESAARLNDINIKARFDDKGTQDVLTRQAKFITISEDLQAAIIALDKAKENNLNLTQEQGQSEKDYQDALKTSRDVLSKAIDEVARLTQAREEQAAANRLAAIEERRAAEERRRAQPAFDRDLKFKPIKVDRIEVSSKKIREEIEKELSKITVPSIIQVPIEFLPAKTGLIEVTDSINNFLADAAFTIGTSFADILSQAITSGISFGDAFKGVFNALGGVVQALGKELIKIGTLALAAQIAINTVLLNPLALVAIGIALAALGSAIQTTTSKNRFAVGTRFAPGGMALVGERGPEMINLPRGSQVIPAAQTSQMMGGIGGAIEVYGMLRGQDIFFSNKKYGQTYKRTT
jgi:hypothetical protein